MRLLLQALILMLKLSHIMATGRATMVDTVPTTMDAIMARGLLTRLLLPLDLILMLTLMAGATMVDTVPTTMDTTMARGKLTRLLSLDPILMLTLMAGATMVDTTVPTTLATTMED